MTIKRLLELSGIVAAVCLCLVVGRAGAAGFDGSTPLLCTFVSALECDPSSGCEKVTIEELDLPQFFKVDVKNKRIGAVGPVGGTTKTGSQIQSVQRTEDKLVLQGVEARGWTLVISEKTGKLTLTAAGDEEAFVLFGACTVP